VATAASGNGAARTKDPDETQLKPGPRTKIHGALLIALRAMVALMQRLSSPFHVVIVWVHTFLTQQTAANWRIDLAS
jgi:hypothetical protein